MTFTPSPARFMATFAAPPGAPWVFNSQDWNRGLRRDTGDLSPDVPVQHHIADHEHTNVRPAALDQPDDILRVGRHRLTFSMGKVEVLPGEE